MTKTKPAPSNRRKYIIPFASATAVMLFGITIFILPPPISHQLHTTATGKYDQVFVGPNIRIDMNSNSSMTVSNNQPPVIELLQGSIYFDITNSETNTNELVAIVNEARIKNIGTRFSAELQNDGGSIAIAEGQVEIQIGTHSRLINAGQQIAFGRTQITEEFSIMSTDVAPWRQNK
jgi:ferric-dicitrate binding protein FerR (iron transport regulator)